jgi:hypothetical protein
MAEMQDNEKEKNDEETFQRIREERQREVDQISLELLSNTKHYKKYIANKCPEEQLKRNGESHRFLKYKSRIAAMFIEMLDEYGEDEDETTPSDLQSIFAEMVQKTIQHLEWTEFNRSDNTANEFDDADMMFANTGFRHSKFNVRKTNKADPYSYWGATIRKSTDDQTI